MDLYINDESLMTEDEKIDLEVKILCITKVQAHSRRFLQRCRAINLANKRFEKIYDPRRNTYYYYDTILDQSQWSKPSILLHFDLDKVAPTYTKDEAAILIQRQLWRRYALRRSRLLYKEKIIIIEDPDSKAPYYYNEWSNSVSWDLPFFMGRKVDHGIEKLNQKPVWKPPIIKPIEVNKEEIITKTTDIKKKDDKDDDGDDDDDDDEEEEEDGDDVEEEVADDVSEASSAFSEASDVRREKRRALRKFPRHKIQTLVDYAEDNWGQKDLDLSGLLSERLTKRLWDLTTLESLNISENCLTEIHYDIQYLLKLTYLDVSNNWIKTFPKSFEDLKLLQVLKANNNFLKGYNPYFYRMVSLEELDFSHNYFTELPIEIGNLELLKETGEWEVGLGLFTNMRILNISHNLLTVWPKQIEKLLVLTSLTLSHNKIQIIPNLLGVHSFLQFMDLSHNLLDTIPTELYTLQQLEVLLLDHNNLTQLPINDNADNKMNSLVELNLSYNKLKELNNGIGTFTKLKKFNASYNNISTIHANINYMISLTKLELSHNSIIEIPSTISSCKNLKIFDISNNLITKIPTDMSLLKNLKDWNISNNSLAELPGTVMALLSSLETLDISKNKIERLPVNIYSLTKLTNLNFSNNLISGFGEGIGNLILLTEIKGRFNKLSQIPSCISNLKNLTILDLKSNLITDLPMEMSVLQKLKRVAISKNLLSTEESTAVLHKLPLISWTLSWNPLQGNFIDTAALDANYKPDLEFIPPGTMVRLMIKAWDIVFNAINNPNNPKKFENLIKIDPIKRKKTKEIVGSDSNSVAMQARREKEMVKEMEQEEILRQNSKKKLKKCINDTMNWQNDLDNYVYTKIHKRAKKLYSHKQHVMKSVPKVLLAEDTNKDIFAINKGVYTKERDEYMEFLILYRAVDVDITKDSIVTIPPDHILETLDLGYEFQDGIEIFTRIIHEVNSLNEKRIDDEKKELEIKLNPSLIKPTLNRPVTSEKIEEKKESEKKSKKEEKKSRFGFGSLLSIGKKKEEEEVVVKSSTDKYHSDGTLNKGAFLKWNEFPRIYHGPYFGPRDGIIYEQAFEAFLGLGTALVKRADKFTLAIRDIEIRGSIQTSFLNVAHRMNGDMEDFCIEVFQNLKNQAAAKQKMLDKREAVRNQQSAFAQMGNEVEEDLDGGEIVEGGQPPEEDLPINYEEEYEEEIIKIDEKRQISTENATNYVKYLLHHRRNLLIWATKVLDSCVELLRLRGWEPNVFAFKDTVPGQVNNTSVDPGSQKLRTSAMRLGVIRGRSYQLLDNFVQAREEYRQCIKLMKRLSTRPIIIELIKINLALGDLLAGKSLIVSLVEKEMKGAKEKFPKMPEIYWYDKELALMILYADVYTDHLVMNGFRDNHQIITYSVQDNGLLIRPPVGSAELLNGKLLYENNAVVSNELEAINRKNIIDKEQEESRNILLTKLANTKKSYLKQIDASNNQINAPLDTIIPDIKKNLPQRK